MSSLVSRIGPGLLLGVLALAAPRPAAPASPAPAPSGETMPVAEVRSGMQGVVRTVFEGDRIEEFGAEIVGVMENFLGPDQDLILARLKGERVEFTGVAGGMSGSPLYIDGRLVGALAYRMGAFMKEPIAGVTPIEYMLEVASPPGSMPPERAASTLAPAGGVRPIDTPLVAAGLPAFVLESFASDLKRLGLGGVIAGAAAASGAATGAGQHEGAAPLRPGDPVAAQLITGDVTFAATGTVTHVDGDRVFAFGHPAFLAGEAEIPMARAEIYMTLPSLQASSKLSRVLDTIGTFRQSRLPAMTGVIGPKPRMIPVRVAVTSSSHPPRSYSYGVVDHRQLTPTLVGLVTAASVINTPRFADEMTMSLSGRIELEGHPALVLNDLYAGFSAARSAGISLARDVQGLFGAVYQNRYERPHVRSVDLSVSSVEQGNLAFVEAVYPTRTELDRGDEVEFRVLIRPYRGAPYTRTLTYRVPEGGASGRLMAYVGGADLLSAAERNVLVRQVRQADDLDQIISLINRLRTSDRLYLKITQRRAGAIVHNEILPGLPPSVFTTLGANRGTGEVTPIAETTVHEEAIPLDQILVGGTAIPLRIR